MKVIFLDVDGVLNYDELFYSTSNIDGLVLSPTLLDLFRKVVQETDAKVVLSSSWRCGANSLELITSELSSRGISIYGKTPVIFGCHRGHEIELWLDSNNLVSRFAIFDDDANAEYAVDWSQGDAKGHFFKTDFNIGLTEMIATQAIDWLNFTVKDSV